MVPTSEKHLYKHIQSLKTMMTRKIYDYINLHQRSPKNICLKGFDKIPMLSKKREELTFKERLSIFFIGSGFYKITDKAEALPSVQDKLLRSGTTIGYEQKDIVSNRDKDEKSIEGPASITPTEKKRIIAEVVRHLINDGSELYLLKLEAVVPYASRGYWGDKKVRISWFRALAKHLKKEPQDLVKSDFTSNGLNRALKHYKNSPYKAIKEAFPEKNIKEWEMLRTPEGFFDKKSNKVAAIKWLVKITKKKPKDLIADDFQQRRLGGLLASHYHNSPFRAVSEAYPGKNIKEWEMTKVSNSFYKNPMNRNDAVRWMAVQLGKDPRKLLYEDFLAYGAGAIVDKHCGSVYAAVREAFPELKIKRKDMQTSQGFWSQGKNRIRATRKLARTLRKKPSDLIADDFIKNGLSSLIHFHNNSPFLAVKEAYSELNLIPTDMKHGNKMHVKT